MDAQVMVQACGAVIDFGTHADVAIDFLRMLAGTVNPAQFLQISDLSDPTMHDTALSLIKDCMGTPS
jgi:hypothetical protein